MSVKFHTNSHTHTHACSLDVDTQTAKKQNTTEEKNIYKHLLLSKYLFKIKMCQTVIMGHLNSTPKVYLTLNMYLRDIFLLRLVLFSRQRLRREGYSDNIYKSVNVVKCNGRTYVCMCVWVWGCTCVCMATECGGVSGVCVTNRVRLCHIFSLFPFLQPPPHPLSLLGKYIHRHIHLETPILKKLTWHLVFVLCPYKNKYYI